MIPYVNDYPVWILETGSYPALENFHTDLRVVLGFLQRATKKEEMWRWVKENKKEFQQLDEDAYDLIQVMANTKGLDVYVKKYQREGGKLDMCQAIEEMLEDERREGIEQGIEQGMERGIGVLLCFCREQGMEAEEIAEKLRRYGLTDQEILRYARKRIGKEKG